MDPLDPPPAIDILEGFEASDVRDGAPREGRALREDPLMGPKVRLCMLLIDLGLVLGDKVGEERAADLIVQTTNIQAGNFILQAGICSLYLVFSM